MLDSNAVESVKKVGLTIITDINDTELSNSIITLDADQKRRDTIINIWACNSLQEVLTQFGDNTNASQITVIYNNRPQPKLDIPEVILKGWQIQVEKLLTTEWVPYCPPPDEVEEEDRGILSNDVPLGPPVTFKMNGDGRNFIVFYNPIDNSGKNTFQKYLVKKYPGRFIILKYIPPVRDLAEIIKKEFHRGWTGETVLINLVNQYPNRIFYESLVALADGFMTRHKYTGGNIRWKARHVVLFTNFMPDINVVSKDRWEIYNICSDDLLERIEIGAFI